MEQDFQDEHFNTASDDELSDDGLFDEEEYLDDEVAQLTEQVLEKIVLYRGLDPRPQSGLLQAGNNCDILLMKFYPMVAAIVGDETENVNIMDLYYKIVPRYAQFPHSSNIISHLIEESSHHCISSALSDYLPTHYLFGQGMGDWIRYCGIHSREYSPYWKYYAKLYLYALEYTELGFLVQSGEFPKSENISNGMIENFRQVMAPMRKLVPRYDYSRYSNILLSLFAEEDEEGLITEFNCNMLTNRICEILISAFDNTLPADDTIMYYWSHHPQVLEEFKNYARKVRDEPEQCEVEELVEQLLMTEAERSVTFRHYIICDTQPSKLGQLRMQLTKLLLPRVKEERNNGMRLQWRNIPHLHLEREYPEAFTVIREWYVISAELVDERIAKYVQESLKYGLHGDWADSLLKVTGYGVREILERYSESIESKLFESCTLGDAAYHYKSIIDQITCHSGQYYTAINQATNKAYSCFCEQVLLRDILPKLQEEGSHLHHMIESAHNSSPTSVQGKKYKRMLENFTNLFATQVFNMDQVVEINQWDTLLRDEWDEEMLQEYGMELGNLHRNSDFIIAVEQSLR